MLYQAFWCKVLSWIYHLGQRLVLTHQKPDRLGSSLHTSSNFLQTTHACSWTAWQEQVLTLFYCARVVECTVSRAYFALHIPSHKVQIFKEKKIVFCTKVTPEAFLSIYQSLKITHLQGGTQMKL